jgi:alpha-amylase
MDRMPATDRVYLPAASYREMGEWVLAPARGRELQRAKRELEKTAEAAPLVALLRGGFWRSFLVRYPEVADMYWKMLRLSDALAQEIARRPDDASLSEARTALWRGQANDAYWHGVFGGCYLPHLRRAVKQGLLECERRLAEASTGPGVVWSRGDLNGDGRTEIIARTRDLTVTVNPERGGTITELGWLPGGLDLADVLTRRPEIYHDRLRDDARDGTGTVSVGPGPPLEKEAGLATRIAYDDFRRASLLDGWLDGDGALDPVHPWPGARAALGDWRLTATVDTGTDRRAMSITMTPEGAQPLDIVKRVVVHDAKVEARYRVRAASGQRLGGRWVVQWNLALTAGSAADRYLDLPGRPTLGSAGHAGERSEVSLVDEWARVHATLSWSSGGAMSWGPVETVSVSEAGFERIYQGTAFLIAWSLPEADEIELTTGLVIRTP